MRKFLERPALIVFITIFTIFPAAAWDDVGHKITGYIAWQRMSSQARENVIKILRAAPEDSQLGTFYKVYGPEPEDTRKREYFMFVPTWADVVRDRAFDARYKKYHKGNWHYDDTFWKQIGGQMEILSGFEEGGQAVTRLVEFDAVIRNTSASNADKAIAIAWIMHLGGDIHQPLHTSARVTDTEPKGDQGGNLFLLTPAGTARENQVNLHWFWDSIVGRNIPLQGNMCERDYIEMVGKKMIKDHPFASYQGKLILGKYEDWQKESFAYNNTVVFSPDMKRNEMPSEQYKKHAFKLAENQLALAGYRLGETLNAVFGIPVPAAVASGPCQVIRKIMYPIFKKQTPENKANTKPEIALLDVCPTGPAARPTIMVKANGKDNVRAFDVAKIFANETEARKYAEKNSIADMNFEIQ